MRKYLSLSMIVLFIIFHFQNCGGGFEAAKNSQLVLSQSQPVPNPLPQPSTPVSSVPTMKTWNDSFPALTHAADCMTNPAYNLCLSYKDPVSTAGAAFSPAFTPESATPQEESKVFVYGIQVPAGPLINDQFELDNTVFAMPKSDSQGDWRRPYRGDTAHAVAQLHLWYWLNRERTFFLEETGMFHASTANIGRKVSIVAYAESYVNNAYYDMTRNQVRFGYSTHNSGGQKAEIALDTSLTAHELGHADFCAASKNSFSGPVNKCPSGNSLCAPSKIGGIRAIHEGQADFHTKLLFPDSGIQGAFFWNQTNGGDYRNPEYILQQGLTAQNLFDRSAEIHSVGATYQTIWYSVWKKARARNAGQGKEITILFMEHLTGLGPSDDFVTAFQTIQTMANQLYPGRAAQYLTDFREAYQKLGLTLPN